MKFWNLSLFFIGLIAIVVSGCVNTNMAMSQRLELGMNPIQVEDAVGEKPYSSKVEGIKMRNLYGSDFAGFLFVEFENDKVVNWGLEPLVKEGMSPEQVEKTIGKSVWRIAKNGGVRRIYGNPQYGWYYVDFAEGKAYRWGMDVPFEDLPPGSSSRSYYSGRSYSSVPDLPDGPRWPKGNSAHIDNVFPKIIFNQNMQSDQTLTTLQKREYSNYGLLGKDIFITTKVMDVTSEHIRGFDGENDSWQPNQSIGGELFLFPIFYDFEFIRNSPDTSIFSQYRKGQTVNIKGKLKKVSTDVFDKGIALTITIEDCEFFDPSDY